MIVKHNKLFIGVLVLMAFVATQVYALSYSELAFGVKQKVLGESTSAYAYETGDLVNDQGTIYFIHGTVKIPFTNFEAFKGLGYSLKNVVVGDLSSYASAQSYFITTADQEHPWGSWLLYKGVVYYSSETGLIPVPSWEIFLANGGQDKHILNANAYDRARIKPETQVDLLSANDSRVVQSGLIKISLISNDTQSTSSPVAVCSYPAPSIGYHYEGQDDNNLCGKYLVADSVTACSKNNSCVSPAPIIIPTSVPVTLVNLSPAVGTVDQQIIVTGTNFSAFANTINFGSGVILNIPSDANGTQLSFTVPSYLNAVCYYAKPLNCLMAAQLVQPGKYPVSVTNSNGVSNSIDFEVTENFCPGPILCAAPPIGYSYSGGGKCSCGTLVPSDSMDK